MQTVTRTAKKILIYPIALHNGYRASVKVFPFRVRLLPSPYVLNLPQKSEYSSKSDSLWFMVRMNAWRLFLSGLDRVFRDGKNLSEVFKKHQFVTFEEVFEPIEVEGLLVREDGTYAYHTNEYLESLFKEREESVDFFINNHSYFGYVNRFESWKKTMMWRGLSVCYVAATLD